MKSVNPKSENYNTGGRLKVHASNDVSVPKPSLGARILATFTGRKNGGRD
jgi:hypothetical protein